MSSRFPVRERKKARSREALIAAARELFHARGYEQTTLEEVAERAGLHVQTLYRHFATKQELALAGDRIWLERFRREITDPQRSGDTFSFWRAWLGRAIDALTPEGDREYKRHLKMRSASPHILGALWAVQAEYEDLLTASLARDFGLPADGAGAPRLVAGMLVAGNGYVLRRYEEEEIDLKAMSLQVIDEVEAMAGPMVKRRETA
ncbi:MAG: TetR family transcriptional regulator [Alphaproteobacteria bacterium]|nr:TetR family transcriptional regulator [Alphaproteobacteria bacterium]